MVVKPLRDKILVKPRPAEEMSKGGIIIPETAKDAPVEGTVLATGNGLLTRDGYSMPLEVKVDDKVLFRKSSNNITAIDIDGEEYFIMSELDILAIIE